MTSTPPLKLCIKCRKIKSGELFYKNRSSSDGLDPYCTNCRRDYNRRYYQAKLSHNPTYRAKRRTWWKMMVDTNPAFVQRNRKRNRERLATLRNRQRRKPGQRGNYIRRWRNERPFVYAAHVAVRNAIRAGELPAIQTQKCCVCGQQAEHYHHHLGYEAQYRLDVTPLCAACHGHAHQAS